MKILASKFWALGDLNQKSKKNSFVVFVTEKTLGNVKAVKTHFAGCMDNQHQSTERQVNEDNIK